MVQKDNLRNDTRFYINETTLECLTRSPIKRYKLLELEVGRIHRYLDNSVYSLYKTDPYQFLAHMDEPDAQKQYQKYCNRAMSDNPDRSESLFRNLIDGFGKNYDPQKGIIVIDQLNCVVEGQHRCCILLKKYGEAHKITVLRLVYSNYSIRVYMLNMLYELKRLLRLDC